jgi:hypothetical protein
LVADTLREDADTRPEQMAAGRQLREDKHPWKLNTISVEEWKKEQEESE